MNKWTRLLPCVAAAALCSVSAQAQVSPLRAAVQSFYAARSNDVRDAVEFDTCADQGAGARDEWLNKAQRRAYDAIAARLKSAYLADPRDAAVEQVKKDFCSAIAPGSKVYRAVE